MWAERCSENPLDFVNDSKFVHILSIFGEQMLEFFASADERSTVVRDHDSWPAMIASKSSHGLQE